MQRRSRILHRKRSSAKLKRVVRTLKTLLAVSMLLHSPVWADRWGAPEPEHWSANGLYVLRVSGCEADLSLWRKTEDGLEQVWARGPIPHPQERYIGSAPAAAYVTNDGKRVVLRDVHGHVGYGRVLVFLDERGRELHSYRLDDILTDDEILNAKLTESSQWWSENGWFSLRDDDEQFAFITIRGTIRAFDMATGRRLDLDARAKAETVAEATSKARQWLTDGDPKHRIRGATLLGVLGAEDAVPLLAEALHDTDTSTLITVRAGSTLELHEVRKVQLAASVALVELMGPEAIALIEDKLHSANHHMQRKFLSAITNLDGGPFVPVPGPYTAAAIEIWERLTEHESEGVRRFAVIERLKRDDGEFLNRHRGLLDSHDQDIRRHAFLVLSRHGNNDDLTVLRHGMDDESRSIRSAAFRGLIRLNLPDINQTLRWAFEHGDRRIRMQAMEQLVKDGDADAKRGLIERIKALKDHSHSKTGWATEEQEAERFCRLVAELKLKTAEAPLREALQRQCPDIRRPVCGALAALGDAQALSDVRRFAREGHALDRASAIRWLGRLGDKQSVVMLREATEDEDPLVRSAATSALYELTGPAD